MLKVNRFKHKQRCAGGDAISLHFPTWVFFWQTSQFTKHSASNSSNLSRSSKSFWIVGTQPVSLTSLAVGTGTTRSVKVSSRTFTFPHSLHCVISCSWPPKTSFSNCWSLPPNLSKTKRMASVTSCCSPDRYSAGKACKISQISVCWCFVSAIFANCFWRSLTTFFPNS